MTQYIHPVITMQSARDCANALGRDDWAFATGRHRDDWVTGRGGLHWVTRELGRYAAGSDW